MRCEGFADDIIEVKRDEFNIKALTQLIGYESWFLQKKISGDMNMLRTTAIARSFSDEVLDYVNKRERIENKSIKLLRYLYKNGKFFWKKLIDFLECHYNDILNFSDTLFSS